jgi:hypothetical protein
MRSSGDYESEVVIRRLREQPDPRTRAQSTVTLNVQKHLGAQQHDPRVDQLIARLPPRLEAAIRWLRRPASAWMRRAVAMLLICGGLLSFLPILGLWMLPLGLLLLAEDVPALKSAQTRILDWVERRHPNWLVPERRR